MKLLLRAGEEAEANLADAAEEASTRAEDTLTIKLEFTKRISGVIVRRVRRMTQHQSVSLRLMPKRMRCRVEGIGTRGLLSARQRVLVQPNIVKAAVTTERRVTGTTGQSVVPFATRIS